MRIFTQNHLVYIEALSGALTKDPASLEGWKCIYVELETNLDIPDWHCEIIYRLNIESKKYECDAVLCHDGGVLFISKEMGHVELSNLATKVIPSDPKWQFRNEEYNLFLDWQKFSKLLDSKICVNKASEDGVGMKADENYHNFGEIYSLNEVFLEAKKLRKGRQPLHVMLVEDDPLTRQLVASAFKEKYVLITAKDAYEAVANYLVYAPDIVFLDIGLPDVNGLSVLSQILKSDSDAYVVMFSGNSYLDNVTNALNSGAAGFVAKPFKKEKLKHYIADSALHHNKLESLAN